MSVLFSLKLQRKHVIKYKVSAIKRCMCLEGQSSLWQRFLYEEASKVKWRERHSLGYLCQVPSERGATEGSIRKDFRGQ